MISRRQALVGGLALMATGTIGRSAEAASWVVLGRREVDLLLDHDEIGVGATSGLFRSMRLKVTDNGILIDAVRVKFGNGSEVRFELRNFIEKGGVTRNIDFPGGPRIVQRVFLNYARRPGGGRSLVTVEGLRV